MLVVTVVTVRLVIIFVRYLFFIVQQVKFRVVSAFPMTTSLQFMVESDNTNFSSSIKPFTKCIYSVNLNLTKRNLNATAELSRSYSVICYLNDEWIRKIFTKRPYCPKFLLSWVWLGNMSNNYFTITQTGMQTIPKKSTYRLNQG